MRRLCFSDWRAQNYLADVLPVDVNDDDAQIVEDFLYKQIGKKYDWRGALQFTAFFRFKPQRM